MDLAKNLKIESVSRLMPAEPLMLSPQQTVRQAVSLMQEQRSGCVLVCQERRVVGIFTERDLLKRVLGPGKPLGITLAECMTADPVTVQRHDSVAAAMRRMQEGGYRHLPVVDEMGGAVGILSVKRIVHYLVEYFPKLIPNQPPDPGVVQLEREGA